MHFDPTISLGTILGALAIVASILGAAGSLLKRITVLELNLLHVATALERLQDLPERIARLEGPVDSSRVRVDGG